MLKYALFAAPLLLAGTAIAAEANPKAAVTRGELPALVREALINDPQIIMDAVKKYQEKQREVNQKEVKESLKKHTKTLFEDTLSPSLGNAKDADITLIEFFDYNCGYCKKFLPSVVQLLKEDKKVRVIFREFPILGDASVLAARAALAVNHMDKGKYFDFHSALMNHRGKLDEKALMDIAEKNGIDTKKLKKAMDSDYVTEHLDETRDIAADLGIRGTPAFLINDRLMPGSLPYEDIVALIADIRSGKGK